MDQIIPTKKRAGAFNGLDEPDGKKPRLLPGVTVNHKTRRDIISSLSDEVLIRILQFLPVATVLLCHGVSKRWLALSTDGEVWRSLYWDQFVRPGIRKRDWKDINREDYWIKQQKTKHQKSFDPTKSNSEKPTAPRIDWKARYRLRHNWSRGSADVREIGLAEDGRETETRPRGPNIHSDSGSLMVRIIDGKILTVDHANGLRVWDLQKNGASSKCIARVALDNDCQSAPTALAIDYTLETGAVRAAVGFKNGGFGIWKFDIRSVDMEGAFVKILSRSGSDEEGVSLVAAAYSHPHLLTITEEQALSLYILEDKVASKPHTSGCDDDILKETNRAFVTAGKPPTEAMSTRLVTSLKSQSTWPPLSLSIRTTPQAIIASIAYSLPTYSSGWSVGLQELHISHSGTISHSRLASAIEPGFHPLLPALSSTAGSPSSTSNSAPNTASPPRPPTNPRPSSLSYSHPYLLASHSNNTLTLYLVTSTLDDLKISMARTLWGHTSSVSGAHVGVRGKAVSISSGGEELRVWELERGLRSRRVVNEESVRVRREAHTTGTGTGTDSIKATNRGDWVGFDDEVVVVLKEAEDGAKALVVYDFK
ncbi:hypothetical protein V494_00063 [Pseudogymnoascus sp. VKM F-4513 (FW-928)]|nr:hypothetical protein V494_00063 [Pseudogymnoascus sp. VKM F-4513 (FW-928)]